METRKQFIVPYSKKKLLKHVAVGGLSTIGYTLLRLPFGFFNIFNNGLYDYILYGMVSIFLLFSFSIFRTKKPYLILNEEGIFVSGYGFILWIDIISLKQKQHWGNRHISICVKNVKQLSKQAHWVCKPFIFLGNLYPGSQVDIGSALVDVSLDEIEEYAKQYLCDQN